MYSHKSSYYRFRSYFYHRPKALTAWWGPNVYVIATDARPSLPQSRYRVVHCAGERVGDSDSTRRFGVEDEDHSLLVWTDSLNRD